MYVIAKMNFFDNEIEQKTVCAASEQEAWVQAVHWFYGGFESSQFSEEMKGFIAAEKYDKVKQVVFNTDGLLDVHKV
jgi:hypothetical protein